MRGISTTYSTWLSRSSALTICTLPSLWLSFFVRYLVSQIKQRADKFYLIIAEPECVNVSFWYVPTRLRKVAHNKQRENELGRVSDLLPNMVRAGPLMFPRFALAKITPILKARMMNNGTLMIGYQPQGELPNFFRNIISNAGVQKKDVDFLLDELDRLGHDLWWSPNCYLGCKERSLGLGL